MPKKSLTDIFLDLVKIPSPSYHEQEVMTYCSDLLQDNGFEVEFDSYGNLIARKVGSGDPLLFAGHADTAPIGGNGEVKPHIDGNTIHSDGTTILGSDNKDNLAAILFMASTLPAEHRALEIIITKEEEVISQGAKHLDTSKIHAKECITSDIARPYGAILVSAPGLFSYELTVRGKRAHTKEPEQGVSANALLAQIVHEANALNTNEVLLNFSYMGGGLHGMIEKLAFKDLDEVPRNSIPDRAYLLGEIRSRTPGAIEASLDAFEKIVQTVITNRSGASYEFASTCLAKPYVSSKETRLAKHVAEIFSTQGISIDYFENDGGSDANVLSDYGIETVLVSGASRDNHQVTEHTYIDELEKLAELYQRLVQN